MRRLMPCFAALALVAVGCGDDDDASIATTTTEAPTATAEPPSTTSSTSSSTSTTTSQPPSDALTQSCTSADGFTISYPEDWAAVSDCGQFGPAPVDEPTPNTDDRTGVVSAYIDPVPYDEVSQPSEDERAREERTVDGRRAVRVEVTASGEGLRPAGTESVRWMVDASDGGAPATLFLDAVDVFDDVDFEEAVRILDEMADSVSIAGAPS